MASAGRGRRLLLARLELTLAAARDDALADLSDALAAARRPIAFVLGLVSNGATAAPLETCVGLIDGIGLMHATGQAPEPSAEQVAAVLRLLARGEAPPAE